VNKLRLAKLEKDLRERLEICLNFETFKELSDNYNISRFFRSLCVTGLIEDPRKYMKGVFDFPIVNEEESVCDQLYLLISKLFDECLEKERSLAL
jgi:hypothetical protein